MEPPVPATRATVLAGLVCRTMARSCWHASLAVPSRGVTGADDCRPLVQVVDRDTDALGASSMWSPEGWEGEGEHCLHIKENLAHRGKG